MSECYDLTLKGWIVGVVLWEALKAIVSMHYKKWKQGQPPTREKAR